MSAKMPILRAVIDELSELKDEKAITTLHYERGDPDITGSHLVTLQLTYAVGGDGRPVKVSREVGGCDY
jgi:hypothetical protein